MYIIKKKKISSYCNASHRGKNIFHSIKKLNHNKTIVYANGVMKTILPFII